MVVSARPLMPTDDLSCFRSEEPDEDIIMVIIFYLKGDVLDFSLFLIEMKGLDNKTLHAGLRKIQ
jgi:hypothetical protein